MFHFFAYISRLHLIKRWGLMRSTREENTQEHGFLAASWMKAAWPCWPFTTM